MDVMGLASLEALAGLVAGVLATIGAIVAVTWVARVIQGGLVAVGRLAGGRISRRQAKPPVLDGHVGLLDHPFLACQSRGRFPC